MKRALLLAFVLLLAVVALVLSVVGIAGQAQGSSDLAHQVQPSGADCQSPALNRARMTVYISPKSSKQFRDVAGYTLANGCPAISVAILFAGNYAAAERPYLRANNDDPPTTKPLNDNLQQVLDDGSVQYLQARGIKVLLSIDNGHHPVGWSEFTSESNARDFAQYLKTDFVDKYGLDGIDIDDEYSSGTPNNTSLIMVTTLMRQIMPDKIISKALFQDEQYFFTTWRGHTLAKNLNYAGEMSYGGYPQLRLFLYGWLMNKNDLSLGFWSGSPSPTPTQDVQWLRHSGYGGVMLYGFEEQSNVDLMGDLVNAWYGPGNWNPPK